MEGEARLRYRILVYIRWRSHSIVPMELYSYAYKYTSTGTRYILPRYSILVYTHMIITYAVYRFGYTVKLYMRHVD